MVTTAAAVAVTPADLTEDRPTGDLQEVRHKIRAAGAVDQDRADLALYRLHHGVCRRQASGDRRVVVSRAVEAVGVAVDRAAELLVVF